MSEKKVSRGKLLKEGGGCRRERMIREIREIRDYSLQLDINSRFIKSSVDVVNR